MAKQLDKLIYVLSSVKHIREPALPPKLRMETTHRKHVELLDDIAFLLVTKARNDVVAVTWHQTSATITFYYAKNAPCSGSMDNYLTSIQHALRPGSNLDTLQTDLYRKISK